MCNSVMGAVEKALVAAEVRVACLLDSITVFFVFVRSCLSYTC